jgi:RNA polymerase sigma-70 factor, ECF subfamily
MTDSMTNIVLSSREMPAVGAHGGARAATSDATLIGLIAAGDTAAMRALFGRHNVRLFRFLVRHVNNAAIAEELLNEVFIEVWRHAGRFAGRSEVSTWLLAIARHKALSLLRRTTSDQLDEARADAIEDPADGPEAALQKAQTSTLLRDCIAKLSAAHRAIIDLVYYHARGIDEVAQILGIPPNTAKTRLFHARKRIAEMLAARGIEREMLTTSLA